jgi:integrase
MEDVMSVRKDKRKGWLVDVCFEFPDGSVERVKKKSPVQTKRGAEAFERQLREQMLNRSRAPKGPGKEVPTLNEFSKEFIETYARSNNKPSEVHSKEGILQRYLGPELGRMKLDKIGVRNIEQFKAKMLKRKLSPKTVNNALAVLSKMLRYAEETELIVKAPRIKLLRAVLPDVDFLTFEEADRLVRAADDRPDWQAMIITALKTGLRYGELCELRWQDVDLDVGRIMVRRSYTKGHVTTPKNGKPREVPLSPKTMSLLRRHRGLRHLQDGLVFCKPDGGRRIHRRADVALKRVCRAAGLRPVGWHVMRHSFASHLVMRGRSLKEIQELLGHSDIKQTMRYSHLAPAVKREAVSTLDEPVGSVQSYGPITAPPGQRIANRVGLLRKRVRGGRDSKL